MGKAGSLAFCGQARACLWTCALSRCPCPNSLPFQSHQPKITRISGPDPIPSAVQIAAPTSRPRESHACCQEPHPSHLCILSPLQKVPWGLSELTWLSLYCEHNRKQLALERGPCGLDEQRALERPLIKVILMRTQHPPLPSCSANVLIPPVPASGLSGVLHISEQKESP